MRAVVIEQGKVVVAERPDPVPGTGEVLIRVQAAGVNNADLMQAAGGTRLRPARSRRTCPAWSARASSSGRVSG